MNAITTFIQFLLDKKTDNIYARKSLWKLYLGVTGLLIILISSVYTYFLVEKLRGEEQARMELYRQSQEIFINTPSERWDDVPENIQSFVTNINLNNKTIPVILTDDHFNIIDAQNFQGLDSVMTTAADTAYIKKQLDKLIYSGAKPIVVYQADGMTYNRIYYDDSLVLTLLKYYPIFQFILIALFIGFGYLAFSSARRNEQNQVWVGMAKETAHQLGTPIAALVGWIEHLKLTHADDPATQQVVQELEKDVSRLDLVADRFSKIGSPPELTCLNIYEELDQCRAYMEKRAPRRVKFDFPAPPQYPPLLVKINAHLFDWVIENLLRNALDALEGEGRIYATVYEEKEWVCADISDTGKGIPSNKFKTIFQPGFTTKKRGWGLGLSLAKRIIENYHGGKIYVKASEVGKFTTFTIKLPKVMA